MAINKRTPIGDIQNKIKVFPGPYVGYVKSATDVNRMGRLAVFIPTLHGTYDEVNKELESQTVTVSYCSPFAGQTPLSETTTGDREFINTQKSYGFWMIPPDVDTKVLVMFANGDINTGFWMGCVFEDYMNNMTPGIASGKFVGNSEQNERYYSTYELESAPVAEAQRKAESQNVKRFNTSPKTDNAYNYKPVHEPQTETLITQGLHKDSVRGTSSASARRETPSQVFGISTPGPIDFNGQQTAIRESINRHGKIFTNGDESKKVAHSRLGGHQFVMDDGTPAKNVNNKITEPIKDELIRLRTRSGAQLLLHNTEGLVYIINNSGTAWIEFTQDGKIDIYAKDSVSIHTENDMNFRADRDINLEAGRNINIKATGQNTEENIAIGTTTTGRVHIEAQGNYELVIGTDGLIKAGDNIKTYAGTDFNVNTGNEIHMNTSGKVSSNVVSSLNTHYTSKKTSIMKRIPTQEPWEDHEDKKRDSVGKYLTDREGR